MLAGAVHRTPVLTSDRLDARFGARIFFKAEHRQLTGSFKIRGVLNRLLRCTPADLAHGVVAGSSGNHGKALAFAARCLGTTATIVLPDDVSPIKQEAITALGARIVRFDRRTTERDELVAAIARRESLLIVPSSDDLDVIAGNGTAAAELLSEVPELDTLVAPVGGGGLAAGSGVAARTVTRGTLVYGAEPEQADDTIRSLRAGHPVTIASPNTVADGLRHTHPGVITFPILQRTLADVLPVREYHIRAAVDLLYATFNDAVEPSGACALAAVLAQPDRFVGQSVGILLTGGNVVPLNNSGTQEPANRNRPSTE
ncbi:threonine/serine dehydratase [Nocardia abscessus]|nr:threonine/serine dehydratase [Nocardia abscessus]